VEENDEDRGPPRFFRRSILLAATGICLLLWLDINPKRGQISAAPARARIMISRPVITKVATCAQPYGPRASELGHGSSRRRRIPSRAVQPRLAQVFNPTETKKTARPECRQALQHGAAASPSQQRWWCCLPRAKAMAVPEASSNGDHHCCWCCCAKDLPLRNQRFSSGRVC
jgi:hypothetical protein